MTEITVSISQRQDSTDDFEFAQLIYYMQGVADTDIRACCNSDPAGRIARIGSYEVMATFVSSAAAYQLASALRDFVNKRRVCVTIKRQDGTVFSLNVEGKGLREVDQLVKFFDGEEGALGEKTDSGEPFDSDNSESTEDIDPQSATSSPSGNCN